MSLIDIASVSECRENIRDLITGNPLLAQSVPILLIGIVLSLPLIRTLSKVLGAVSMVLALFAASIAGNGFPLSCELVL